MGNTSLKQETVHLQLLDIAGRFKCAVLDRHYINLTGMFDTTYEVELFLKKVQYYTTVCDRCGKRLTIDLQDKSKTEIQYETSK